MRILKRHFLRTVICFAIFCLFVSCAKNQKTEAGFFYNKQFNESKMTSITGKKVSLKDSNIHIDKENGFAFVFPAEFAIEQIPLRAWNLSSYSYDIVYFPPDKMEILKTINEQMEQSEALDNYLQAVGSGIYVCSIFRSTEFLEYEGLNALMENLYPSVEFLGTVGKSTYYFASLTNIPDYASESDKENLLLVSQAFSQLRDSIMLFPGTAVVEE